MAMGLCQTTWSVAWCRQNYLCAHIAKLAVYEHYTAIGYKLLLFYVCHHISGMCVQSNAHFYRNTEQGRSVWWNLTVQLYVSILSFAQNVFHTVLLPLQNSDYIVVWQVNAILSAKDYLFDVSVGHSYGVHLIYKCLQNASQYWSICRPSCTSMNV